MIASEDSRIKNQSISESISKSMKIAKEHNILLLHSASVDMSAGIAKFVINENLVGTKAVVFIDFQSQQIEEINHYLREVKCKKNYNNNTNIFQISIIRLNDMVRQKRSIAYLEPKIYTLSSQIFLLDLLTNLLSVYQLEHIFIRMKDKITDIYHNLAWIATLIKLKSKQPPSISFFCSNPYPYNSQNSLEQIYRACFINKIVIWPFGRSQIHQKIKNNPLKVLEISHQLSLLDSEQKIHEILMNMIKFVEHDLKKKSSYKDKNIIELLYDQTKQFSVEKLNCFEMNQLYSIRHLMGLFLNCQPITVLIELNRLMTAEGKVNNYEIWHSNNSVALKLTTDLQQISKLRVFRIFKIPNKQKQQKIKNVNIAEMLQKIHFNGKDIDNYKKYDAIYNLDYDLELIFHENIKMIQLTKILQDIMDKLKLNQINRCHESKDEEYLNSCISNQPDQDHHKVIICCAGKYACRNLHAYLFQYIHKCRYVERLRSFYSYLQLQHEKRIKKLIKIYERIKIAKQLTTQDSKKINYSHKKMEDIRQQNQIILLQKLYAELEELFQLLAIYEHVDINNAGQSQLIPGIQLKSKLGQNKEQQWKKLLHGQDYKQILAKNLKKKQFAFFDSNRIIAPPAYNKESDIEITSIQNEKRIKIQVSIISCMTNHLSNTLCTFTHIVRFTNPTYCIFYSPNTSILRNVYLQCAQSLYPTIKQIRVMWIAKSFQVNAISHQVVREDQAFWNISKFRKQLAEYNQEPELRKQCLNINDDSTKASYHHNEKIEDFLSTCALPDKHKDASLVNINVTERRILIDTRQFKSSLPSYLFHYGFTIFPVFLQTGDYILSNGVAVEKKSVQTKDLHESLRSYRLEKQMKRMCKRFTKPYLLIECSEESDFRKQSFWGFDGQGFLNIRKLLVGLIVKYPKMRIIWSTSLKRTCEMFKQLKRNEVEPEMDLFTSKALETNINKNSTLHQDVNSNSIQSILSDQN